jgi:hypothetical protein
MAAKKKGTTTATVEGKEKEVAILKPDGKTIMDKISHKQVINMSLLEPNVREKVLELTVGLQKAFTDVRVGFLKIGQLLSEAEMILKPRGLFVNYLNSFPGFKQAQAYRYINGYMIANKHYPPAVLDSILATGIDMIGTKDRPFGKYQEIVKQLPPPKDADAGKAQAWLNQVTAKYTESRKKANKVVDATTLQKEAFNAILKRYAQVPDRNQLQWIRKLFGYVFANLGMKQDETIEPIDPPADWIHKTGESEKTEEA